MFLRLLGRNLVFSTAYGYRLNNYNTFGRIEYKPMLDVVETYQISIDDRLVIFCTAKAYFDT